MDKDAPKILYRDGMDYIGLIPVETKEDSIILIECLRCMEAIEQSNALI